VLRMPRANAFKTPLTGQITTLGRAALGEELAGADAAAASHSIQFALGVPCAGITDVIVWACWD
jgi:hypothetical protein